MILITVKHANFLDVIYNTSKVDLRVIPALLAVDWVSLAKSKFILTAMSKSTSSLWIVVFVLADVISTIVLLLCGMLLFQAASDIRYWIVALFYHMDEVIGDSSFVIFVILEIVVGFFLRPSTKISSLLDVAFPSTMLTSAWVIFFMISALFVKLLAPLEYVRRFTLWWFKDSTRTA